jgi:hypothetical protein
MKRVIALGAVLLTACSSENYLATQDTGAQGSADHSSPPDSGQDDTGDSAEPAWFDLSGTLSIEGGALTSSSLTLSVLPEDASQGVICATVYGDLEPQLVEPLPDPLVFHWWQIELPDGASDCEGADRAPRRLRVGLGELYPALEQGVDEHGLAAAKDSLYGAYASFEAPVGDGLDGTTYAYGYAGTEQDRAGETTATEQPPLPDGTYELTGYYLFRLP